MTTSSPGRDPALAEASGASVAPRLRVESAAIYLALIFGGAGALVGLVLGQFVQLPLAGEWSFGVVAAIAAGISAATVSALGYWRARSLPGQEWRLTLSPVVFSVNLLGVVLVHTVLAVLVVLAASFTLNLGFLGLLVEAFWATVLMALASGVTVYFVYLSVSTLTTQRMSSLLMTFVVVGTLTAMVTTTDPEWWKTHFSHLGSFWTLSSLMFNGTLVAAGLLVTAFAVSVGNDSRALVASGALRRPDAPRTMATAFILMGALLSGVGLVPVNVSLLIHNLCAMGLAVVYLGLLIAGPRILEGMPRTYFVASWCFLAATIASLVLFAVGYFGLTAFEIVVFALIFGWIAVFIRFLGVADQGQGAASTNTAR